MLEITDSDGNKIFTTKIVGKMLKDVKSEIKEREEKK